MIKFRNVLIEDVLSLTLELVELLTLLKIERDTVSFFMQDYRYFYHHSYVRNVYDPSRCSQS